MKITLGKWAVLAVKLAVTISLLWYLWAELALEKVSAVLEAIQWPWIFLAFSLLTVQFAMAVVRWRIIVAAFADREVKLQDLAIIQGLGILLSQVLPSTVGGDVARSALLGRMVSLPQAVKSVLVDRLFGLIWLSVLTLLTLPVAAWFTAKTSAILMIPAGLALASLGGTYAVVRFPVLLSVIPLIGKFFSDLLSVLREVLSRLAVSISVLSLAIHVLTVLSFWAVAGAVSVESMDLGVFFGIVPAALLVSAIPISFGGWGLREGAVVSGFALFNFPTEIAFVISVMFGLCLTGLGLLGGLAWVFHGVGEGQHAQAPPRPG